MFDVWFMGHSSITLDAFGIASVIPLFLLGLYWFVNRKYNQNRDHSNHSNHQFTILMNEKTESNIHNSQDTLMHDKIPTSTKNELNTNTTNNNNNNTNGTTGFIRYRSSKGNIDTDTDNHIDNFSDTHSQLGSTSSNIPLAIPCPWSIRILVTCFIVIHSGIEVSYGAWISSYAIEKQVTKSDEDAAFIESSYWAALTLGTYNKLFDFFKWLKTVR